jgi:hypothetical protein
MLWTPERSEALAVEHINHVVDQINHNRRVRITRVALGVADLAGGVGLVILQAAAERPAPAIMVAGGAAAIFGALVALRNAPLV